jgi:hypothetical protein
VARPTTTPRAKKLSVTGNHQQVTTRMPPMVSPELTSIPVPPFMMLNQTNTARPVIDNDNKQAKNRDVQVRLQMYALDACVHCLIRNSQSRFP